MFTGIRRADGRNVEAGSGPKLTLGGIRKDHRTKARPRHTIRPANRPVRKEVVRAWNGITGHGRGDRNEQAVTVEVADAREVVAVGHGVEVAALGADAEGRVAGG